MRGWLDRLGAGRPGAPAWFRALALASAVALGAAFLAAAWPKIRQPEAFALEVFRYQAFPDGLINLTAIFLPWFELVCGLALIAAPRWRRAAGGLLFALLVVFTVLLVITIARGIQIRCGCFSVDPDAELLGWKTVARNLGLVVLAALAAAGHPGGAPFRSRAGRPADR